MIRLKNVKTILVVSENKSFYDGLQPILPPEEFETNYVSSAGEARRFLLNRPADIMIINTPLPDEHALIFAQDYLDSTMGIMVICKAETYADLAPQAEEYGIVALSDPCPPAFVYVAAKMLSSITSRLQRMEQKNKTLLDKMADLRTINKAKWLLIDKKKMSEPDAHKYIEKLAMDKRISSGKAAQEILEMLE
ncbi:MAG: ANTAR domain-containing protein [Treponema sp.]|nr:ANTAR domain-containing protein [Treponema sp.]